MEVGSVGEASFAGGVPDPIPGFDLASVLDASIRSHMHIEQGPAGFFVAIPIKIEDDRTIIGSDDHARRGCCYPCICGSATGGFTRRGKIKGSPARACIPTAMRATGK